MPLYHYIAKDLNGKNLTGEVDAKDEKAVAESLRSEGLITLEVKQKDKQRMVGGTALPKIGGSVSTNEVVTFTRQLSTMLSAGLPLTDAISILRNQTKSANFSRILTQVEQDVEGGMSLSSALSKHHRAFDIVYIKLIEAGETGGVLDKVLLKLAQSLEKDREFKSKTRGAFIYPFIVVLVMILVVGLMMVFVIPKLTALYEEIGTELPLPTKILIAMSDFTRNFWWLLIIGTVVFVYAFKTYSKTPIGSQQVSRLVLSLPVWGKIRKTLVLAEFSRTLGLLIGTGIPIITALKVVRDILTSKAYKDGVDEAIRHVERGTPLYQPIAANSAFPPLMSQMMRVGEETGKMDEVLGRLALFFEGESEHQIQNLTTALEPIILVILGLGVGTLVLSIILPIYNLTSQF